jgi:hypothetical protein
MILTEGEFPRDDEEGITSWPAGGISTLHDARAAVREAAGAASEEDEVREREREGDV